MKTLLKLCCFILTGLLVFMDYSVAQAQSPQGINYQAVARDNDGNPLNNSNINVRFSVFSGGAGGALEWEETHSTTANSLGLFNLVIGEGTNTGGNAATFADIDWGADEHHLNVEVDFGSGYVDMGTTQFMSVPYALSAESVTTIPSMGLNDLDDVNTSGTSTGDVLSWDGSEWMPEAMSGSVWSESANYIYYNTGKVGIGYIPSNWAFPDNAKLYIQDSNNLSAGDGTYVNTLQAPMYVHGYLQTNGGMTGIRFSVSDDHRTQGGAAIIHERTGGWSQGKLHFATKNSSSNEDSIPIRMTISEEGNVGIGNTSPEHTLHVSTVTAQTPNGEGIGIVNESVNRYWNIHMTNPWLRFSIDNDNVSYIHSDGSFNQTSDLRLKENIQPLNPILDNVLSIQVKRYNYKRNTSNNEQIGLIAQDAVKLFPEFVSRETEDDFYGINYAGFSVIAIKAIQEQQAIIDAQAAELEQIKQVLREAGFEIE